MSVRSFQMKKGHRDKGGVLLEWVPHVRATIKNV